MATPDIILDDIGAAKVEDRVKIFVKAYIRLCKHDFLSHFSQCLDLNIPILRHCVECYFADINRTKDFHKITWADQHKCAAYTIKWITKLRPLQTRSTCLNFDEKILQANEIFAITTGLTFLQLKPEDF
ncbi:MAG: hypothetical protein HQK59_14285, partial [Deltaproteobacteria bacterium]|nr:hypothetical protein [Deltaproteobacteria bacterium]